MRPAGPRRSQATPNLVRKRCVVYGGASRGVWRTYLIWLAPMNIECLYELVVHVASSIYRIFDRPIKLVTGAASLKTHYYDPAAGTDSLDTKPVDRIKIY